MAQNMNAKLMALCREVYEEDGLAAVRNLAKQIAPWCKERLELEKRGAAEAKLHESEQKKLDLIGKAQVQPRKALIRELRKNETFKQLKTKNAEAEKAARKAAADAKKLAAAEAKANKPTKATKAWGKLFDKSVKKVNVEAKKAATQLKALVTLKKKAVAKATKEAAAAAKKEAAEAKKEAAKAKTNKPSKVDSAMVKRWSKVLTKGIKRGETETKKALSQLKQLKTKKMQANAKAAKEAAKAAKKQSQRPRSLRRRLLRRHQSVMTSSPLSWQRRTRQFPKRQRLSSWWPSQWRRWRQRLLSWCPSQLMLRSEAAAKGSYGSDGRG